MMSGGAQGYWWWRPDGRNNCLRAHLGKLGGGELQELERLVHVIHFPCVLCLLAPRLPDVLRLLLGLMRLQGIGIRHYSG